MKVTVGQSVGGVVWGGGGRGAVAGAGPGCGNPRCGANPAPEGAFPQRPRTKPPLWYRVTYART